MSTDSRGFPDPDEEACDDLLYELTKAWEYHPTLAHLDDFRQILMYAEAHKDFEYEQIQYIMGFAEPDKYGCQTQRLFEEYFILYHQWLEKKLKYNPPPLERLTIMGEIAWNYYKSHTLSLEVHKQKCKLSEKQRFFLRSQADRYMIEFMRIPLITGAQ